MRFPVPQAVQCALDALWGAGFEAYLVGGCVRDDCLGTPPHDYDVCTAAMPGEIHRCFPGCKTIDTGEKHGTVTVLIDHVPIEITAFRADGVYLDGRHPETVRFTRSLEEDLARRDFTVNAMAYSDRTGLVDLFAGREDLRLGVIRCVGEPEKRFAEDALRILRGVRFCAKLDFAIEPRTAAAMEKLSFALCRVSRERVAAELSGTLLSKAAGRALIERRAVIAAALPALRAAVGGPEQWEAAARAVDFAPEDLAVRWAALLGVCSGDGVERAAFAHAALSALKMPRALIERGALLAGMGDAPLEKGDVWKTLADIGPEAFEQLIALKKAAALAAGRDGACPELDALQEKARYLIRSGACLSVRELAVGGEDLKALGAIGPAIGRTLSALLAAVTGEKTPNRREALLALARQMLDSPG